MADWPILCCSGPAAGSEANASVRINWMLGFQRLVMDGEEAAGLIPPIRRLSDTVLVLSLRFSRFYAERIFLRDTRDVSWECVALVSGDFWW